MTGLEALLYLHDPAELSTKALHDQILHTWAGYIQTPGDQDPIDFGEAFGHLLAAYSTLIVAKYEANPAKMPPKFVGQEAEDDWRAFAADGYRQTFPDEPDGSEAVPWWPDELDINTGHHRSLLRRLAFLTGYHAGITTRAQMNAYHRLHPTTPATAPKETTP